MRSVADNMKELMELVRKSHEISYKSTVDLSILGIQQLGLVHGGATVAIIAFIGTIKERPGPLLQLALICFAFGILCNLLTVYFGRASQWEMTTLHAQQLELARIMVEIQALGQTNPPPFGDAKLAFGHLDAIRKKTQTAADESLSRANAEFDRAKLQARLSLLLFVLGTVLAALFFAFQYGVKAGGVSRTANTVSPHLAIWRESTSTS